MDAINLERHKENFSSPTSQTSLATSQRIVLSGCELELSSSLIFVVVIMEGLPFLPILTRCESR